MPRARLELIAVAASISVAVAVLMLATEPQMAIGWDEGYTLGREARLRAWFGGLRDPATFAATWRPLSFDRELVQPDKSTPPEPDQLDSRAKLLTDRAVLEWFWPFAREEPHGHPPFYALLGLAGDLLVPSWQDLPRARLGPILLFSVTAGLIYAFAALRWGRWPGTLAAGAWVLQPNLFGHGHYAAYDAILTALWVLAIMAFGQAAAPQNDQGLAPSRIRWGWAIAFGVLLGCAAMTKFTGWMLPLPFLVWTASYRSRRGLDTLALGGLIAIVVAFALMPPWWTNPVQGLVRFFESNLSRGKTIPIQVAFLGTIYNTPRESLPWYNTLFWVAVVTPIGFLIMAGVGYGAL